LSKDQEIQGAKEKLSALQRETDSLHSAMAVLKGELEVRQAEMAAAAAARTEERLVECEEVIAGLRTALASSEAATAAAREQLAELDGAADGARAALLVKYDWADD
jgi:chromosome segregation ATPase